VIRSFRGRAPRIHPGSFVHDSCEIVGRVEVKRGASIWPLCVLRGDVARIVIGERTNVQDLCVIHGREGGFPTILGRGVTVGHRAVLHGARVGDGCLIGMGAVVMEAVIGSRCLVGAGSLVLAGMRIPPGSLAMGSPARVVRRLNRRELDSLRASERRYLNLAKLHRGASRPCP